MRSNFLSWLWCLFGILTISCAFLAGPGRPSSPEVPAEAQPSSAPSISPPPPAPTPEAASVDRQKGADGAIRLTAPPRGSSDQNPAFSPDGAVLLFTRFEQGYNLGPSSLYMLNLASGSMRLLTAAPDSDNVNLPGSCWNAATGRIVFASDRQDTEEIWHIDQDGNNPFRVTFHHSPLHFIEPSFSPDGGWIAFEIIADLPDDRAQGSIWKIRADGSGLTQLTSGYDDRQPNWSPGGDRILFQRRAPGRDDWNIYTMLPDGSDTQPVTTAPSSDTDASWAPDGNWIVYSSDYGGLPAPNIFIISVHGGVPLRVTLDEERADSAPSWSPDGKWIAFESRKGLTEITPASLWMIQVPPQ